MISDNLTHEPSFYATFWPTPISKSITVATAKVPGYQKLFEICYMLMQNLTKLQLPMPRFLSYIRKEHLRRIISLSEAHCQYQGERAVLARHIISLSKSHYQS